MTTPPIAQFYTIHDQPSEKESVFPMCDRTILPLFTTRDNAQQFVRQHGNPKTHLVFCHDSHHFLVWLKQTVKETRATHISLEPLAKDDTGQMRIYDGLLFTTFLQIIGIIQLPPIDS